MTLDRNTTIRFIHNGKQLVLKILFFELYYNKIPLYYSDNINEFEIIMLSDKSILIVCNRDYRDNTDAITFDIRLWSSILKLYYKNISDRVVDIHCAYWFGFSNVINNIKSMVIDNDTKNTRIKTLEHIIASNNTINIITKEDILQNLRFIEIN